MLKILSTKNVGKIDRLLRALPLPIVTAMYFYGSISEGIAIGLGVVTGMLFITSILGSCSIYYMLGYSTCPLENKSGNGR
ncbi:MAG: DUF2892 domain-containing protein [Bdellovibrionales bacterium CG10_big_fil_rev_8_21_14_0_10_45_34]|nr:MAG: DUF2892 domain-containing protein [Bdellovibrionales bacterium CG10_big_fil_rev_8_21_14_0_10_45_34]